jgi:hypothetical protein
MNSARHFINLVKIYQICKHFIAKVGIIKDTIKKNAIMRKSASMMKRIMLKQLNKYGRTMEIRKIKEMQR